jgi:cyclophilin family peptidyl-prolyl cis-trans isomerase
LRAGVVNSDPHFNLRETMITIKTNHGDIGVELFDEKAPISCENFRQYIKDGHYAGTIFHRVIPNFMIQGGGMDENMSSVATREPIKNEADNGEANVRGTLAMARTNVVDSATSQFFINLRDNDFLNHGGRDFGYAVFAKVSTGMDVVDAIAGVQTGNRGGHQDVPVENVEIIEVTIDE